MRLVEVRSVLNRHRRRDPWFLDDYSVNPYSGCPLGCVYCYLRGGRYGSWGEVRAKVNAPEVLDRQLSRRALRGEFGVVALGTSTEPYMPAESGLQLTRRVLSVVARWRFPVHVLTKATLARRDADLLLEVSDRAIPPADLRGRLPGGALVTVSMCSTDPDVARVFEPGAPSPSERLDLVSDLTSQGVPAGVALIPVLPLISDSEEEISRAVREAADSGASYVFVGSLTLYGECKRAFYSVLRARFPGLLPEYERMYGRGWEAPPEYRERLRRIAEEACARAGVRFML
ncbi:MAG: radical SAM protein [Thermoproteota archaeon]|nr:MAG: radical SAM protein [Candidatus Korarchaeota archaeon]